MSEVRDDDEPNSAPNKGMPDMDCRGTDRGRVRWAWSGSLLRTRWEMMEKPVEKRGEKRMDGDEAEMANFNSKRYG